MLYTTSTFNKWFEYTSVTSEKIISKEVIALNNWTIKLSE